MPPQKKLLRNEIHELSEREHAGTASETNNLETDRLTVSVLFAMIERLEALEARVPTVEQLEFLTERMEDQRWQLETWKRVTKWGGRIVAVLGAYGLVHSLGWRPIEMIKELLGGRPP